MKKALTFILCLAMMVTVTACGHKLTENGTGITGTWYEYDAGDVIIHEFTEDGVYKYSCEAEDYRTEEEYSYDSETGELDFPEREGELFSIEEKDGYIVLSEDSFDFTHDLYRTETEAKENSPYYLTSDEYLDTITDDDGWCIADGVCYAYRGDEKEVTVPDNVIEIYMNAFSGDMGHGTKLEKVVVSGNVVMVDDEAFAYTEADVIVFEEGVEELGDRIFMDSYVKEVHFADSITELGTGIMDTEEGLDGAKIYVKAGTAAAEYFEANRPYGDCEIIEE